MKYCIVLFFICSFSLAKSQETRTLLDCVNIAIENSLEIQQANNQLESSTIDYKQSKMNRLPNISGSLSNQLNFGRSLDITSYQFSTQNTSITSAGLNGGATLFAGGQINNNIKLQALNQERNQTNIKKLKDDIAIQVAQFYLQALVAKEQIEVVKKMVELRQQDADRNQQLIDAGVSAESTQVDMDSQLANSEFQLRQAQNSYESALLQLKQVMMTDFKDNFDVVPPDVAFPSIEYLEEQLNPDIVYPSAVNNLHVVDLATADVEIAEINKKLAKSQYYPTVSLSGALNSYSSDQAQSVIGQDTYVTQIPVEGLPSGEDAFVSFIGSRPIYDPDYNLPKQFKDNFTQNVGVSISFPIFNQGQVTTQVKQAEVNVKQARIASQIQERQLEQTIQSAYLDAQLAYRAYESAQIQLESSKQAAEYAKKRLDIGTASIYDYFMAQNNFTRSEVELTQSKYDYLYKVKILEFYKENQFEF